MSKSRKVNVTRDYRLFSRSADNRVLDIRRHKKLERSMKQYGFLPCFPVVCCRDDKGKLIVKDGQHRLAIAETLGLPVHWMEEEVNFDVAIVNSTAKTWATRDYAEKYAANGVTAYVDGLEFSDRHGVPVGIAFAMLAGTTTFKNIEDEYKDGEFKIKDRAWAESVAAIYGPITDLATVTKNSSMLAACMAVCRVDCFEAKRLLHNAERCRDKLLSYSTREAYLDMLEEIYNFGRKQLVGLKALATMAMRERNATIVSKKVKQQKDSDAQAA